jgi:hypothetical protein
VERVQLFFLVQGLATLYALLRGGAPERIAGLALATSALATLALQDAAGSRFFRAEVGVLVIDVLLFSVLLALAVFADRFWTFWLAALQGLGTLAHVIKGIDVAMIRVVYAILIAGWSYPMILLLLLGTGRHQRRVKRFGRDLDWS